MVDRDILAMSSQEVRQALQELRDAVRTYRDEEGHERCFLTAAALFALLPEKVACRYAIVSDEAEFLRMCSKFRSEDFYGYLKTRGLQGCPLISKPAEADRPSFLDQL